MTKRISAGILLYRIRAGTVEVFLVHPGGPYWQRKDAGAWSIPKGEAEEDDDLRATAEREFHEETGTRISGDSVSLTPLVQPSGKVVHAWAVRGDIDAASISSNTFAMEWPPSSGKQRAFPEVDRGEWFTMAAAKEKLTVGQRNFLDQLQALVDAGGKPTRP